MASWAIIDVGMRLLKRAKSGRHLVAEGLAHLGNDCRHRADDMRRAILILFQSALAFLLDSTWGDDHKK
jgi:hypothetical protein